MKLVVISPEAFDPRETDLLAGLFAAGLERYHVRKPAASRPALAAWLAELSPAWRARMVLHQHHDLVDTLEMGGRHDRDVAGLHVGDGAPFVSRSTHDLATLESALGRYDAVFFSPMFPSISKPGHWPRADFRPEALAALLASRSESQRRTDVLALGGVTPSNIARCRELGFDGVAVLGAVWQAPDPVRAFVSLQEEVHAHAH